MSDLKARLRALGLLVTAAEFDDLISLATKKRWGPQQIIEHVVDVEEKDRARRGLERRRARSRLERFKPMADFDWNWPKKIERPLVESVVRLDFIESARNVVLVAPQGLPNATCATALIDRVVHHADVIPIEGESYRAREAEQSAKDRRAKKKPEADPKI